MVYLDIIYFPLPIKICDLEMIHASTGGSIRELIFKSESYGDLSTSHY